MPGKQVGSLPRIGCTDVSCYSKHWPCLFPQHGPGLKHRRPIVFEPWQLRIVLHRYPGRLLRGLVHSDGCRHFNTITAVRASGETRQYRYVRYNFTNESQRIRDLFVQACWRVDVDCRQSNRRTISVSRRESVAILDSLVGPKS